MVKIVVLPGDGIGPEVTREAVACLQSVSDHAGISLNFETHDFGGIAIDNHGDPFPDTTLEACNAADAILLGAVGGPQWDLAPVRPEAGLLGLRRAFGLFANLRPTKVLPGLEHRSPLRHELVTGADIMVIRELTGGLYFGEKRLEADVASDLCIYTRAEVERIAHVGFQQARQRRGKLTSVDKSNVLHSSKLWRRVVMEVATDYPDVELHHLLVDAAAMHVITTPKSFDVIVTENMFGDILSDELSVLCGSLGLLGSASIGLSGPGLFEPIHGSAPDIAGMDAANPSGAIASAAMLLDHLGHKAEAKLLDDALEMVLINGPRTRDLGGIVGCAAFGAAVRAELGRRMAGPAAHVRSQSAQVEA